RGILDRTRARPPLEVPMRRRTASRLASGALLLLAIAFAAHAGAQPVVAPVPRPGRDRGPPLPEGAVARIGQPRLRLPGAVINVAFAPAGTTFVTTNDPSPKGNGDDRLVVLWDATTGREIRQFRGHQGNVDALAYSADGTRIATAGGDQTVRLWNVETGAEIRVFTGHKG